MRRRGPSTMPGSLKTDAIVLRSIRFGEGDRVLHLYTPQRGRVGAIAKGARKTRSRFGGRLEPFFHLRLVLHEGRGDLLTVTSAETVAPHACLRGDGAGLDTAARACDAVVCSAREASAFQFGEDAHAFLVAALARPLAEAPDAEPRVLRQAERAIGETLEHHAHVRLRPAVAA